MKNAFTIILFLLGFCFKSSSLRLSMSSITVIGANGKTGSKIVKLAVKKGWKTTAVTRSGVYQKDEWNPKLTLTNNVAADITKNDEVLKSAIKASKACVFAASASKEGGNPQQIDKNGLIKIAKLCIELKVPRLVIISSGAVSKPFSPVYLFLNLFGGIMKAKIEGENEVRRLYASDEAISKKLSYTIIRPGGLTEDEPRGVEAVELNQGDDRSGRISRWDVAAVAVECITSKDAAGATLECYYSDTSQPLANVGLSNILKRTSKDSERVLTGRERRGRNWIEIFKGLSSDINK